MIFDKRDDILFLLIFFILIAVSQCQNSTEPAISGEIYKNSNYAIEDRVDDLMQRMTLSEKIGQMIQVERRYINDLDDVKNYNIGSILSGGGSSPYPNTAATWANMVDNFQLKALDTRLGIPIIYGVDAVHGHNNVYGATIFPHNIGMGCTRNSGLVEQAAAATAIEVAGTGIRWTFSPCIAVPQDERWGRTYEGFGETAELTVQMAAAAVKGYQGNNLAENTSILACAKHFLGDGGTNNGYDQGDTQVDEYTMRNLHMPAYVTAINEGVGSVMVSFSSWNGQKMHGSEYWLTTVLKNELGFAGFVVSDWGGIDQLPGDFASDIETSINAGIDMVMLPKEYHDFMTTALSLVNQGRISESRIDDAVSRILKMKFALGLFENPLTDRTLTGAVGSQNHRDIARQCVRESLVLLKNENNVLPIADSVVSILVAGKNADDLGNQCGGWTISWQGSSGAITVGTTVLEAIENRLGSAGTVHYSITGNFTGFADIGVVVIGETPYAEGNGDRRDLSLSSEDITTVEKVFNSGIPTVVILISGRPLILDAILDKCDAIIAAWLPGTEGDGIADVLFGDYSPKGKLSHSWMRNMEQIPINVGDIDYDPLFEYGFGLTY